MTKKQTGAERVYLVYTSTSLFIIKGGQDRNFIRAGTWRQELMQNHGALLLTDLLNLLSDRTQDHQPRGVLTHNGLGLSHHSFIKKIPYSWILWRHYLKEVQITLACGASWHKTSHQSLREKQPEQGSCRSWLMLGRAKLREIMLFKFGMEVRETVGKARESESMLRPWPVTET